MLRSYLSAVARVISATVLSAELLRDGPGRGSVHSKVDSLSKSLRVGSTAIARARPRERITVRALQSFRSRCRSPKPGRMMDVLRFRYSEVRETYGATLFMALRTRTSTW